MKTDKMFKELGYEKQKDYFGLVYRNKNNYAEITFDLYDETICASINDGESVYLSMQELQAINQKCKELGWLNKNFTEKRQKRKEK